MTKRSRRYFQMKAFYKAMNDDFFDPEDCWDEEEDFYGEDEIICYMCQTCGMDSHSSDECPNCGAYDMEPCYF